MVLTIAVNTFLGLQQLVEDGFCTENITLILLGIPSYKWHTLQLDTLKKVSLIFSNFDSVFFTFGLHSFLDTE